MNAFDFIVLGAVLIWLAAAIVRSVKKKRSGHCIGCSECCPYKDSGKCSRNNDSSHIAKQDYHLNPKVK